MNISMQVKFVQLFVLSDQQTLMYCDVACRVAVIGRKPAANSKVPHFFLGLKKEAWT